MNKKLGRKRADLKPMLQSLPHWHFLSFQQNNSVPIIFRSKNIASLYPGNKCVFLRNSISWIAYNGKSPIVSYPARGQASRDLRYAVKILKHKVISDFLSRQKKPIPNAGVVCHVILILLIWMSTPLAIGDEVSVRAVQRLETKQLEQLGISNPIGVMGSPNAAELIVLDSANEGLKLESINLDQYSISFRASLSSDLSSTNLTDRDISDPINSVFDEKNNRILILLADNQRFIEYRIDDKGKINSKGVFNITNIPANGFLEKPQGITINPETGTLYILDSAKIVQIDTKVTSNESTFIQGIENNISPEAGSVGEQRGIAFNRNNGLLYFLNPVQQKLYSSTVDGLLQATYDSSKVAFSSSDAVTFSSSGDSTDDPRQLSLYVIAQSTLKNGPQIVELSLPKSAGEIQAEVVGPSVPSTVLCTSDTITVTPSILIQTIDLSGLVNPNPPPGNLASPDPSGITYLLDQDVLWIADGEVTEVTGAPSNEFNVFEIDYSSGDLITPRTVSTSSGGFSDETTGASEINFVGTEEYIYISDDDKKIIQELNPGQDRLYGSTDDVPEIALDTLPFGSGDPEGVAMGEVAPGHKFLFIADGVDNEIYKVDMGDNQRLDASDSVTSFDTSNHLLVDPEGVAFNRRTGTLIAIGYARGDPREFELFEFDVNGNCKNKYSLPTNASLHATAGLAFAPSSLNSADMNVYIVDRGIDNDEDPNENDGLVFEYDITPGAVVPRYILPHNQWQAISLPMMPPETGNTVLDIFGDDGLGEYGTHWSLRRYDTSTSSYNDLTTTNSLSLGVGYWIIQNTGYDKELYMPTKSVTAPTSEFTGCSGASCFKIPLDTKDGANQWNLIGYPFTINQSLSESRIVASSANCAAGCTLDVAEGDNILNNKLWAYNGSTFYSLDTATGILNSWQGYWTSTLSSANEKNPEFLIPMP